MLEVESARSGEALKGYRTHHYPRALGDVKTSAEVAPLGRAGSLAREACMLSLSYFKIGLSLLSV